VGEEEQLAAWLLLVAEVRQPRRHRDPRPGRELAQRPPAPIGEERVRLGGAHHPPEAGPHLEHGLQAVVDERRRRRHL
jgi:hypothetical protein